MKLVGPLLELSNLTHYMVLIKLESVVIFDDNQGFVTICVLDGWVSAVQTLFIRPAESEISAADVINIVCLFCHVPVFTIFYEDLTRELWIC